jgi:alpha-amylase
LPKFHLSLLIHAHQPVGNFDDVLERAYAQAYLPFVEMLCKHPQVRLGLHYSGCLLEWIEKRHPEFFDLLRSLVAREQVELVGGGFYEPILIAIPPQDRLEQIRRMADYLHKHFGRRPAGAWLAERVWEPQLPSVLAAAGVEYTLVDDIHFLAAGIELEQLYGYYVAEDLGATVKLLPGLKRLRYAIPFGTVEENIAFLREAAARRPGGLAAMGDDNEKFGIWPETHLHCYTNGWLERFFAALEENASWLDTIPPGAYVAENAPLGRADLPAASYSEMMEWALPTPVRARFHELLKEFSSRPEVHIFLRGSIWRNFFSKYAEANLLHKKMLHVSEKIRSLAVSTRRGLPLQRAVDQAATHLLRAECNDAYWHGIFGGIYAPHLRTVLWRELIRAEKIADAAEHGRTAYSDLVQQDFDADGQEEIYVCSETMAALIKPGDGGTLAALDFRPADVTLINSMQRRPEPYHARLRQAGAGGAAGAVSIHEQSKVKEPGLERRLRYDRWPRHAFRLLVFSAGKQFADYEQLRLDEDSALAGGSYSVTNASPQKIELARSGDAAFAARESGGKTGTAAKWGIQKSFSFSWSEAAAEIACEITLTNAGAEPLQARAGLEQVINLLAPDKDDRYIACADARYPLGWSGELPASSLRLVDEWQNIAVTLEAPGAEKFWVAPIETVSESEEGFERVYQGSQILAVWPLELAPGATWTARLFLRLQMAR